MKPEFLTPLEIWDGYNPSAEPLEISALSESESDGVKYSTLYFTAHGSGKRAKKIRAYGLLAKPLGEGPKPAVLYMGGIDEHVNKKYIEPFVKRGYITLMVDYIGGEGEFDTVYPEELSYCNLNKSGRHFSFAEPSAKNTVWYWWTLIAMRGVSVLQGLSSDIAVVGVREATTMLYQTLAFDRRVKGGCALLGAGWNEYAGIHKYGDIELDINDERECFISGVSPQSYAQFIKKPLLYLGSTNSADIDRLGDTFKKLPVKTQEISYTSFSVGHNCIREFEQHTLYVFLQHLFFDEPIAKMPELDLKVSDGVIYAELITDESCENAEIYISVGEINPELRCWKQVKTLKVRDGNYLAKIQVSHTEKRLFVFGKSVQGEYTLSTRELSVVPRDEGARAVPPLPTRIIYDSSFGRGNLVPIAEHVFVGDQSIEVKQGPLGISGIFSKAKGISVYSDGDSSLAGLAWTEIQFDAYCEKPAEFKIAVYLEEEGKLTAYSARVFLAGSSGWQRISVDESEFKNEINYLPLKSLLNVKRIDLIDCGGILFNNIVKV